MVFTTPFKNGSIKIMLLGSGELGREVAIEALCLGCEVVAVDKYENAPAGLVATKAYAIDMKNKEELLRVIRAVLGLPLSYRFLTPGASAAYKAKGESHEPKFDIPNELFSATSEVRVFGKPESHVGRRMAVVLASDTSAEGAKEKAAKLVEKIMEV